MSFPFHDLALALTSWCVTAEQLSLDGGGDAYRQGRQHGGA
jgi:hypothetical protein